MLNFFNKLGKTLWAAMGIFAVLWMLLIVHAVIMKFTGLSSFSAGYVMGATFVLVAFTWAHFDKED